MKANTSTLLSNFDLKDLFHAYTLAYLEKAPKNRVYDLGIFEESNLIRTKDNSIFTLFTCPEITNDNEATKRQVVSANLQEQFVAVIAHFILNNHARLPSTKLKMAFCINHQNIHWTTLLAEFSGLNARQYNSLYKQYQQHARQSGENVNQDGSLKELTIRLNNVKNFLIANTQMRLNEQTANGKLKLGNCKLPLSCSNIALKHFDSMGTNTHYGRNVASACKSFTRTHRMAMRFEKTKLQNGNTCGDWSVYNAFSHGVLQGAKAHSSEKLRFLSENITVENAHNILFTSKPCLTEATPLNRICVTNEARRLIAESSIMNTYSYRSNYEWFKTILFGIALGALCYAGLSLIITLSTMVKIGLGTIAAFFGIVTFDTVSSAFFGQRKFSIRLDKHGKPCKDKVENTEGLSSYFGYNAPYLMTAAQVRHNVEEALLAKGHSIQQSHVLAPYYTQKIVKQNMEDFYDEDKKAVCDPNFIDMQQVRKYLRSKA